MLLLYMCNGENMRLIREINEDYIITNTQDNYKYLKEFENEDREFFIVLGLDTRNKVLYRDVISIGTLNMCPIHPREIFKTAIMRSVNSIIIAHNHPSGNKEPSKEDITISKKITKAGELLQIKVLDSLIITKGNINSFNGGKE